MTIRIPNCVPQGELDFIRTKWDMIVDEESLNPGKQIFEKERVKNISLTTLCYEIIIT